MLLSSANPAVAESEGVANPFLFRSLQRARDAMAGRVDDPTLVESKDHIVAQANKYLTEEIYSVMNKNLSPFGSQNKHDYYAQGPYLWPDADPKKPWIYKDGQKFNQAGNPQYNDRDHLVQMADRTYLLSIAFYLTRDPRYANHAAEYLKRWFIIESTKMNENLAYSSVWPNGPRSWGGVLTGVYFCQVIDAVNLLGTSDPSFTSQHREGVRTWFHKYYKWLTTDPFFSREGTATNNHGTWYDVQQTCIALFLDKKAEAKTVLEQSVIKRLDSQVAEDGSQRFELARTKPLHYSIYNLDAFFQLALLGERVNVNLWNATAPNSRATIKAMYDYLVPFLANGTIPKNGKQTYEADADYGPQSATFAFLAPRRWTYDSESDQARIATMDSRNEWNYWMSRLRYSY